MKPQRLLLGNSFCHINIFFMCEFHVTIFPLVLLSYLQVLHSWPIFWDGKDQMHIFLSALFEINHSKCIPYLYNHFFMFKAFFINCHCSSLTVLWPGPHNNFFPRILAILWDCCQTPFHSLISNVSIKFSTSPCGILSLNITFMLSFFQKSNNEPCNCVTNFFQNLSLPNAHTKCCTVSTWEALHSEKFTIPFILQIAKKLILFSSAEWKPTCHGLVSADRNRAPLRSLYPW